MRVRSRFRARKSQIRANHLALCFVSMMSVMEIIMFESIRHSRSYAARHSCRAARRHRIRS
jgi:hypothetical protein